MRCKTCDYRLWNLTTPRCPECGTPFRPSEYEFTPNSVAFCCPHCNQAYYGTGDKGHLVPSAFNCVSCGRYIHMDEMVLRPTEGVDEEQTGAEKMPWLDREKRGLVRAWFSMIRMGLFSPVRLMQLTPSGESGGGAMWFAVLSHIVFCSIWYIPFMALMMFAGIAAGGRGRGAAGGIFSCAGIGGFLVGMFVILPICLFVWGVVAHGVLRLTGDTSAGMSRTFHALGYTAGANAGIAVPCFGVYLSWLWWLISSILALREAQRVSAVRAVAAVLLLPVLFVAGTGTLVALEIRSATRGLNSRGNAVTMQITQVSQAQPIVNAILAHAKDHNGKGPQHAAQLIDDNNMALMFVSGLWGTIPSAVPIGNVDLVQFESMSEAKRDTEIRAAVKSMPPGVIAHRLGDYVFTYHGMDLSNADPDLWIVVQMSDQSSLSLVSIPVTIVGMADGRAYSYQAGNFKADLAAQNQLRAKYNLPPLPDPRKVTHAQPAVDPTSVSAGVEAEESGTTRPKPNEVGKAEEEDR